VEVDGGERAVGSAAIARPLRDAGSRFRPGAGMWCIIVDRLGANCFAIALRLRWERCAIALESLCDCIGNAVRVRWERYASALGALCVCFGNAVLLLCERCAIVGTLWSYFGNAMRLL
jgi:hypothetical protein